MSLRGVVKGIPYPLYVPLNESFNIIDSGMKKTNYAVVRHPPSCGALLILTPWTKVWNIIRKSIFARISTVYEYLMLEMEMIWEREKGWLLKPFFEFYYVCRTAGGFPYIHQMCYKGNEKQKTFWLLRHQRQQAVLTNNAKLLFRRPPPPFFFTGDT